MLARLAALRTKHILGLFAVFLFSMGIIKLTALWVELAAGGIEFMDLGLGDSATQVQQTLFALGGGGRDTYLYFFLPIDALYAAIYALFYSTALGFLLIQVIPKWWRNAIWGATVPFIAAACDWCENILFATMIARFPAPAGMLVTCANIVTMIKFILVYTSVALILGLLAAWATKWALARWGASGIAGADAVG